jgi:cell division protein FtsQ
LKIKKTIRKVLVLSAWTLVGCGMTVLLIAANRKQDQHFCRQVVVSIKSESDKFYIDKGDILKTLQAETAGKLINQPVTAFNLSRLEKKLENGVWVSDAELYFDSRDVLHVLIKEREPIARVFTTAGTSFYIDSTGKKLPLLDKVSVRVPVVTNFTAAKKFNAKDSAILKGVTGLLQYISAHSFWSVQIAQIDITPSGTFEAIPVVGNHIIKLGTAERIEEKLQRLFVFYKQVLSKTGFDKYAVLDVQYKGQVVAGPKNTVSKMDSIQLQKNIKELIDKTKLQVLNDSIALVQKAQLFLKDTVAQKPVVLVKQDPPPAKVSSKPSVKSVPAKAVAKPGKAKKKVTTKPKAVMKRMNEY